MLIALLIVLKRITSGTTIMSWGLLKKYVEVIRGLTNCLTGSKGRPNYSDAMACKALPTRFEIN